MIILGIDPALTQLGWGVISFSPPRIKYIASGIVKTSSKLAIHYRLNNISNAIKDVIDLYKPSSVAMEETYVNSNAASSLKLGYARGAIMALIGSYDLPFFEFKPNFIKKSVVGAGHAEKEQVMHMIKIIISGCPILKHYDEADALAVAYTCSLYNR